ncbi:MAG: transposase [Polyangiaceae bacterium]
MKFTEGAEHSHEEATVVRPSYPQDWAAYNQAQINEKDQFELILKDLCATVEQPRQGTGRPRLPLSDVVFACTLKVYSTISGRRASSDVRSAKAKGLIDEAPHHNSISHYLRDPELTPVLVQLIRQAATPLKLVERDFAVDATGFGTSMHDRWFDHKYGRDMRSRRFLKAHAIVGVKTNVVADVEVTDSSVGDVSMYIDLINSAAQRFTVKEISADKAYLSAANLLATEGIGAEPFIPFKSNSRSENPRFGIWERLFGLFWFERDRFLEHYHKRSNVEATFGAIKKKFGGSLRSKQFESQKNELLCKFLAHNIVVLIHEMYELGIDPRGWDRVGGRGYPMPS